MLPGSLNHEPDQNDIFFTHFYTLSWSLTNHERGLDQGGTPLYKGRVGVLGLFSLKTLCPFWSGIGYGFRGNYGSVHEWTYLSFQFQMNKNK